MWNVEPTVTDRREVISRPKGRLLISYLQIIIQYSIFNSDAIASRTSSTNHH